jgi:hypothetical protein
LLTILKHPKLIESAFNPITFDISYSHYTIGDMFYLELKDEQGNIIDELEINGNGLGFATFDISQPIQSFFKEPKILNPHVVMQKDETALVGYQVQIGLLRLIDRKKIKHHCYTSDTFYALRSALAFDNSQNITELTVDYQRETQFLTSVTSNQTQNAELYLPVLFQAPTTVKLVLNLYSTKKETTHTINSLGVYVFNVQPELQGVATVNFSAWLESTAPYYIATMSATTTCEIGEGSFTASVTKSSMVNLEDAQQKALAEATTIADANLVCDMSNTPTYTSTQSHTATCSDGYTGTRTATATRTSTVSQADANSKAKAAAKAEAEAKLVCTPVGSITYTSQKSHTATCTTGSGEYTATATRTSTVSQADADTKAQQAAKQEAEANLVCSTFEQNGTYSHSYCNASSSYRGMDVYHNGSGGYYEEENGLLCGGSTEPQQPQ